MSTQFGATPKIDPMGFAGDVLLSPCYPPSQRRIWHTLQYDSIMSVFLLSSSSNSTEAYFAVVLGQISVTVRSPWPERSL
jgi:hypothetical protein